MSDTEQLMWRAIEGALGAEKRAFLQNAPLTTILGSDANFALPHAMGALAASGVQKHAEAESIRSGLQALEMVCKEAGVAPKESFLQKVARAYQLRVLEPATAGGTKQAAVHERRRLNTEIMETVKRAGAGGILDGISTNPMIRETGKKMLQGLGVGAGLSVPAYGVGSALSDKFTADSRDRALQTAGGVAGIGMLGYGAKKLMDQAAQDRTRSKNYEAMDDFRKTSSAAVPLEVYAALHVEQEKVAYVATCVYLDVCLSELEQTHKIAALRDLNNEFMTEMLATSVKTAAPAWMKRVGDLSQAAKTRLGDAGLMRTVPRRDAMGSKMLDTIGERQALPGAQKLQVRKNPSSRQSPVSPFDEYAERAQAAAMPGTTSPRGRYRPVGT